MKRLVVSRKRCIKLLMAMRIPRNRAAELADFYMTKRGRYIDPCCWVYTILEWD